MKTIYYSLVNSHLIYGSQIWGQTNNCENVKKLQSLQDNKALRIINNFKPPIRDHPVNNLYTNMRILKLRDFITLQNILFAKDCLQGIGPEKFSSLFNISGQQHRHNTRRTTINKCLVTERTNTDRYGTNSIKSKCIKNWNNMQRTLDVGILDSSRSLVKIKVTDRLLIAYISGSLNSFHRKDLF